MKYNELQLYRNSRPKRAGRGISAGRGMTAGRGTKGQGARKSGGVRPGFEGGQIPLYMRLPKLRGFKAYKPKPQIVYTGQLDSVKKTTVDSQVLHQAGLIADPHLPVKLLLKGDIKSQKTIRLPAASSSAAQAVKKAGGSFEKTDLTGRPKQKTAKTT